MASLGTLMDHQEKTKHSISVSLFQSFVCHSFSSKKSLIHQTPSVSLVASFKSRSLYTKNTRSAADFFLPRSPRIAVQVLQASRVPYECTINPKNWDRKGITWDPQCQCSITKDHALNIPKPNFWIIFVKQISWSIYKTLNKPTVPLQSSAKHAGLWLPQPNKPHFQDAGRSSWRQSWGILTSFFVAKKKSPATREIPGPHLQCRGWCAAEFGPWIGPFLQCLGSRQPNGFPKSRGGNIKLVQRKFHECTQNQDIENVYQINESMPSSPTNSAMATAFGSQFGLMRWEYIANIWKKGLLLNSYISIFFFRLGQSFSVSSTDCFICVFFHTWPWGYIGTLLAPSGHATSLRLAVERLATGHCRCPVVPGSRKWQQTTIENSVALNYCEDGCDLWNHRFKEENAAYFCL